ncbi:unnamed protein product [Parajaminaea phylloscopi]
MSATVSASASPGPSAWTVLETLNQHDVIKPFKRVQVYSNSSTGRRRNYKQIVAAEQEAQFELGGGISSKRRYKKKKVGGGANAAAGGSGGPGSGASTPPQLSADGTKQLIGAAAKAARKREERLKRESALKEAAAMSANASAETSPAPDATDAPTMGAGQDELDGDTTMRSEAEAPVMTEEQLEQQRAEEQERTRKLNLPTYLSVEAPPSLRPAKKYCDVTGLLAPYTDPKTGLRYHSAEIYEVIKTFAPGVDQAYLTLRGRKQTLM